MVREHSLYDLNYFQFIEHLFYILNYDLFWRVFHEHLQKMSILQSLTGILKMSIKSSWLIVLFKYSLSLLIFFLLIFLNFLLIAQPVWLSWLEHCPIHWMVVGSIPVQGTYLGCRFDPPSGCVQGTTTRCLSLSFSLYKQWNNILRWGQFYWLTDWCKRENHWFVVLLICAFTGWSFCVPWAGIKPPTWCFRMIL